MAEGEGKAMSLFGGMSKKEVMKQINILYNRCVDADGDRRRIKDNADKFGGMLTDLECRLNKLEEGLKHGKKHKH